jgi:hypothetical protein
MADDVAYWRIKVLLAEKRLKEAKLDLWYARRQLTEAQRKHAEILKEAE